MMSERPPRPVRKIDAELRGCRALQQDAETELAEVRRRQAELLEQEATLLAGIDMRCWRTDRLLDERLRAVAAAEPSGRTDRDQRRRRGVTDPDTAEAAPLIHR